MNIVTNITNGPYLLAPSASEITIAWEMDEVYDVQLSYSLSTSKKLIYIKPIFKQEPACREYPQGCYLYTVVLKNLSENEKYNYQISDNTAVLVNSSFKTLSKEPQHFRLVTLSDSHLFNTEKKFEQMINTCHPDFVIHSGDISFGTGYQREQYVKNWFQKIPNILKTIPFYYIPGNHDDGPFYESFFAQPQAKSVNGINEGHTYSFNYGKTHFTMIDSNSWGLFEMNAVNSGLEVDPKTKKCIADTIAWIKEDLASKEARNANWRILILHHPYTDSFNNKYIVPIAEQYGVNLVIAGHLHYYVKAISINPLIGTNTTYICQGSLQDPEAEFNAIEEKRLLGDFPEVVAMGRSNYGILDINENYLTYKIYGFNINSNDSILIDTIKLNHCVPQISLSEIELKRLDNNGHIEIRLLAKNTSNIDSAVNIKLFDNNIEHNINLFGIKNNSHVVVLCPGEEKKLTAIYKAVNQGEHNISVENQSKTITVFEPTQLTFSHMKIFAGKNTNSNKLLISIEATNNLDREIFTAVPLYINQRIAESKNLFFRGHEKKSIEFIYKFNRSGSYQISIADQLPKEFTIEGGIQVIPIIQDKSGNDNNALLHGSPKILTKNNNVEICLEQYGDYIEIPSNPSLTIKDAFSGIVWAKINRLAKNTEMGHNPLMVKGKSVGWGATYLLRMVVERTGGLKWGICHDITEYSWQGGNAKINEWAQYAITFDKKNGGNSYCDNENIAHVTGIAKNSTLRQWETEPIFIGYSYIGHIIDEIDRPKYFTHLPAYINQVRFYKTALSEKKIKALYAKPYHPSTKSDDLAIWLDFKNILTVGTHITEWRHPVVYDPKYKTEKKYWFFNQLKTKTILPLQSSIKATIEVSDDKSSIKGLIQLNLKDGTNYIDISALPSAQYIRITTEFSAQAGEEGTFIPKLQEYQITATDKYNFTEIIWSTRESFSNGKFIGAVGFAPIDRLKEYPEYTDIIHG